jgi:hypothetical protein
MIKIVIDAPDLYDLVRELQEGRPFPLFTLDGRAVEVSAGNPKLGVISEKLGEMDRLTITLSG